MSLFVAGAAFGEVALSLFVAGAIFGEVAVSLFVAVSCSDHSRINSRIILGSAAHCKWRFIRFQQISLRVWTVIFRGRRSIWWVWTMTHVALRIVNNQLQKTGPKLTLKHQTLNMHLSSNIFTSSTSLNFYAQPASGPNCFHQLLSISFINLQT